MADTTLDSAGRVVIPKALRDELGLSPGDALSVQSDGQQIVLRPIRSGSALRKENGIWVFRSGQRMSAEDASRSLDELRRDHERAIRGTRR